MTPSPLALVPPGPVLVLLSIAGATIALAAALLRSASRRPDGRHARAALATAGGLAAIALACLALVARGPASSPDRTISTEGKETGLFKYENGIPRYSPSQTIHDKRTVNGRTVYDATYTTDAWGNRVTPEAPDRPAVIFFGCSFTFGEGLRDDRTLPWQFALDTGNRFDVVNAAISGSGPHQMLRMLETGVVDARLSGGVVRAFYGAIPDHVARAATGRWWDPAGPRYEIEGKDLRFAGTLRSPLGRLFLDTAHYVIGGKWEPHWEKTGPADEERWARIVARSAALVREKWGTPLTVVMWDTGPDAPRGRRLGKMLRARGLDVVFVGDLVPRGEIRFIPGDGHPAAATNVALARALAEKVFPGTPVPGGPTPGSAARKAP